MAKVQEGDKSQGTPTLQGKQEGDAIKANAKAEAEKILADASAREEQSKAEVEKLLHERETLDAERAEFASQKNESDRREDSLNRREKSLGVESKEVDQKADQLQKLPSRAEVLRSHREELAGSYRDKKLPTLRFGGLDVQKAHRRIQLIWPSDSDREPDPVAAKVFLVIPTRDRGGAVRVTNCTDESDAKCAFYFQNKELDPRRHPVRVVADLMAA